MAQLIVRKLDDGVKERLRLRAKGNGRSLEAEAREILERSLGENNPAKAGNRGLGKELAKRIKATGVTKADVSELERNIAELRKQWRARGVFTGR